MATAAYESALQLAASLSREEQLRLISKLAASSEDSSASLPTHSILELEGLGKEIWKDINVKEYLRAERDSWDG